MAAEGFSAREPMVPEYNQEYEAIPLFLSSTELADLLTKTAQEVNVPGVHIGTFTSGTVSNMASALIGKGENIIVQKRPVGSGEVNIYNRHGQEKLIRALIASRVNNRFKKYQLAGTEVTWLALALEKIGVMKKEP